MDKFKSVQELLNDLLSRRWAVPDIAREVGYHESALYKVNRGEQADLPYKIGKRIEILAKRGKK